MASIEMNMLSVITCGSISIRVFCPGMSKLALDDTSHQTKYPVLSIGFKPPPNGLRKNTVSF